METVLMSVSPLNCVVLVPAYGHVEPECERALQILHQRGYTVRKVRGIAAIDQGRSQMATDMLAEGFDEIMWVDSDVGFNPDDVDRLRNHNLPIVAGLYPKKGERTMAVNFLPDTRQLVFGSRGGLIEVMYVGFGFVHTRREVFDKCRVRCNLPLCNTMFDRPIVSYFLPMLHSTEKGCWYLGEDYAFCERVRQTGFAVYADTSVRLWHVGSYKYG